MPENPLLRLSLLSPAHLGSAWGEASLDRPTQADAWHGLPFVPASALKGVMAGRWGNVPETVEPGETDHEERERRYGSPDRPGSRGRPSRVVLGDGRPLAFPVPAGRGRRCWVFPADTLAWALRMEGGDTAAGNGAVSDLLGRLEAAERSATVLATGAHPRLPGGAPLEALTPVPDAAAAILWADAGRLAGPSVPAADRLITGGRWAAELWRLAAERRHLTAVDAERRVVRAGSLRSVELVPEGAVFLSLVSLLGEVGPDLGRIQVGAWESLGFGWAELTWADEGVRPAGDGPPQAPAIPTAGSGPSLERLMAATLAAVRALAATGGRPAAVGRSAVRAFGWRFRQQGAEAALAFELARARPFDPEPEAEHRAHRWLLTALLLDGGEDMLEASLAASACRPLVDWLAGQPFAKPICADRSEEILTRLGWLRRYGELELPGDFAEEKGAAP